MKKIALLLSLGSCAPPPVLHPPGEGPDPVWILVSRPDGLWFEREVRPVRVETRGPELAPVGEIVEVEAWVVDPEPGAVYVLEARPSRPGLAIVGPAVVPGPRALFRVVSQVEGKAGLVVEAREHRVD